MDPVESNHIAVFLDGKYVFKTQNPNIVPEKKGDICGDFQFPILQMDSSIVRWFEGSQTIVNIRGVQKLHLPSDSCWKFLTHHVICHGEIHRNMNNLLQTFISSPNWARWLSMVVYHKSNDAMVTKAFEAQHLVQSVRCSRLLCPCPVDRLCLGVQGPLCLLPVDQISRRPTLLPSCCCLTNHPFKRQR